ncbi:hypothetical protein [Synechococcus sp. MIT S1220]|uniref:hypothetical protein n=1 Tax=Synechococcus sp. MIT S1220 TaxID=3082549 RepID=UPI0039B0DF91
MVHAPCGSIDPGSLKSSGLVSGPVMEVRHPDLGCSVTPDLLIASPASLLLLNHHELTGRSFQPRRRLF